MLRALVVDDSRPTRGIIAKMMRALDFETTEASDGREALGLLDSGDTPDVVTVNWHMPGMNGLELVNAIRGQSRFRNLPLLMISGEAEENKIAEAMSSGISGYIVKPCTPKRIATTLQELGLNVSVATSSSSLEKSSPNSANVPTIRVLVVDDSSTVRRVVSATLSQVAGIEIVGTAANGKEALDQIVACQPNIVLLDVEMPVMDGLETLREIRKRKLDVRVVMFSSLTQRGAKTATESLLLGAKDFVFKPGGTDMNDQTAGRAALQNEIVPKLRALFQATGPRPKIVIQQSGWNEVDLVVMGSSTGGPAALGAIFSNPLFKSALSVPIVIAQHMPPLFTQHLAKRLAESTQLDIAEATAGEELKPGMIRIGPGGDHHVQVHRRGNTMTTTLNSSPPVNSCRPSADVLFQSAAKNIGPNALAVVLTGIGQDGLEGCRSIVGNQGRVVVQDQASSVIWGMPGSVATAGLANLVLPLSELGPEIARRMRYRKNE